MNLSLKNLYKLNSKGKGDKEGQTFHYIERKARSKEGKWATSTMGEYQDGGFYWKRWEVYDPENTASAPNEGSSDDVGF